MNKRNYLTPIRKWWWLLVVATLLAALASYLVQRNEPFKYTTRTTLIVGSNIAARNPTDSDFRLARQLATLYADIATRDPIRLATMQALGLRSLPPYTVDVPLDSQMIEISVTDNNPARAQAVATELAAQLILESPSSDQGEEQARQAFLSEQLIYLESKIIETQDELILAQDELAEMDRAEQIAAAQADINGLQSKLTTLQTIYAALLSSTGTEAVNTLSVVERAAVPAAPVNSNRWTLILMSALFGLVLAVGAAYLLEYLDDTIKTPDEAAELLRLPVIGRLGKANEFGLTPADEVGRAGDDTGRTLAVEAFRSLRTNLDFAGVDRPLKTILITSPGPGDGKSSVAANLAVAIARTGKRVILLDADLRRPGVHKFFDLENRNGLSQYFLGEATPEECIQLSREKNLWVVTAGSPPPNPTELLTSKRMDVFLQFLEGQVDTLLVDGPPFLLADASVLAAKVDGVLLVIRPGHTKEQTARSMLEQMKRAGAQLTGMVLTGLDRDGVQEYMAYWYEAQPDGKGIVGSENGDGKSWRGRLRKLMVRNKAGGSADDLAR